LKEAGAPSGSLLLGAPKLRPAERIIEGFRSCIPHPPRAMGMTRLRGLPMFGRRLAPQEDKLNLRHLRADDLPSLASYLGALVGAAHARGATSMPRKRWSKSDCDHVRAQAITLAGIHEAVYLALCDRMRGDLPKRPPKRRSGGSNAA
jgi:hypothetical protein